MRSQTDVFYDIFPVYRLLHFLGRYKHKSILEQQGLSWIHLIFLNVPRVFSTSPILQREMRFKTDSWDNLHVTVSVLCLMSVRVSLSAHLCDGSVRLAGRQSVNRSSCLELARTPNWASFLLICTIVLFDYLADSQFIVVLACSKRVWFLLKCFSFNQSIIATKDQQSKRYLLVRHF